MGVMIVNSERGRAGWRRVLILLAAVLSAALTFRLGLWQLDRAAQKNAIAASQLAQAALPTLNNADFAQLASGVRQANTAVHRTVVLQGRWLDAQTLYLDNRQMNAKPGFYAITPFLLAEGRGAVLVQRGWIPRDFRDRTRLQAIQSPTVQQNIAGRLALLPSRIYELGAAESGLIRQNVALMDWQLPPGVSWSSGLTVVQTDAPSEGLLREWPQVDAGVSKHHGYAFQWFALSAVVVLLYGWFQVLLPWRKRRARR